MKKILIDPSRVGRKLAFWRVNHHHHNNNGVEVGSSRGNGTKHPESVTEEQVGQLIQTALEVERRECRGALAEQKRELQADFAASLREHLTSFSRAAQELHRTAFDMQQSLVESSRDLRREIFRFAEELTARLSKVERGAEQLDAAHKKQEHDSQRFIESFTEQLVELNDNIETTNSSLFVLHRSTGQRLVELTRDYRADVEFLRASQSSAGMRLRGFWKEGLKRVRGVFRFAGGTPNPADSPQPN